MSKTKKIRRLQSRIEYLTNKIDTLKFSNSMLLRDVACVSPSRYYTPRPEFRSQIYTEEHWFNNIINYIYSAMDKEYRKVFDTEPHTEHKDIKFIVYMSHDIINKLCCVSGYGDFGMTQEGVKTFRGWVIVRVDAYEYIHFVRKL